MICGVFAGVVTLALVRGDASDRRKLNDEFRLRTLSAGSLVESYVGTQESLMIARAEDLLSGRTITRHDLQLALSGLGYQGGASFDGSGRVLVNQPYTPSLIGRNFSSSLEHVHIAVQQNRPGVSQALISPGMKIPVAGIAVPYRTGYGRRIFTGAFALQGPTLNSLTRQEMGPGSTTAYLIDRHGNLIASTVALGAAITPLSERAPGLARALARNPDGTYQTAGQQYRYASAAIGGTGGWRLVTGVRSADLYAPLSSGESTDRWLIVATIIIALAAAAAFGVNERRRKLVGQTVLALNAELELAQRIAELGSFSTDPGSGEMVWSAETFRIFARDPASGPPRATELLTYIHPEDVELVRAAYKGVLGDDTGVELDVRVRAGDCAERILHLIVRRDPDRHGFCWGTVQDVTRLRAVERALREQSARAESASQAKNEFLARMSHELRTPLNSIMGFGQLLELEGLDPRQREHVDYVLKASGHLLELINEVLELAKIEAGQTTISPEPVALADLVREALALIAPLAAEHDITLASNTDGLSLEGHVQADRQRLAQVLLNLFSNAIKYNRAGGRVDVSFAVTEAGRVRTTIADTGIGLQPAQLAKLFDPFERLGAELTQVEGTGLGLALSKGLLEAMGGTIEVASQPAIGTAVTIELASAQPSDSEHTPGPRDQEPAGLGERGSKRQVILYIEDNLSNLTLVERILDRYPAVELLPAMQATIGLELARQHRPDLIVLDLHLPDMPGTEVLNRLKAQPPTREIPVIVLTADASKGQSERVTALGAAAYLTKPLDVPRFVEVIADNLAVRPVAATKPQ
jgi:signal transduction histidine kinase/ActR/RegA family two-component response regulator